MQRECRETAPQVFPFIGIAHRAGTPSSNINTERIQRADRENTRRIQREYRENVERIYGEYRENTERIQRQYKIIQRQY